VRGLGIDCEVLKHELFSGTHWRLALHVHPIIRFPSIKTLPKGTELLKNDIGSSV